MKKYFVEYWNEEKNSPRTFFDLNCGAYVFFFNFKDEQTAFNQKEEVHGLYRKWWNDSQCFYFTKYKKAKEHGINILFKEKRNAIL